MCSAGLLVPELLPPILSLSRAQLGTPLAQQQLDTFCSCSLLCGLCKSSHLDLVEQKYFLPLYSFSLILSYREILSWSSTASLDHLSLLSRGILYIPREQARLFIIPIFKILESKIELLYVEGKDIPSVEKER